MDYQLDRGVLPLHDAVGVNCKNGTSTENEYVVQLCVYSDFTLTTPPSWREHVLAYYYYFYMLVKMSTLVKTVRWRFIHVKIPSCTCCKVVTRLFIHIENQVVAQG